MRTEIKAVRSKPQVSTCRAVGTIVFKADNLADAAILTAMSKAMCFGDGHEQLREALIAAANKEAEKMRDGCDFEMIQPKRRTHK